MSMMSNLKTAWAKMGRRAPLSAVSPAIADNILSPTDESLGIQLEQLLAEGSKSDVVLILDKLGALGFPPYEVDLRRSSDATTDRLFADSLSLVGVEALHLSNLVKEGAKLPLALKNALDSLSRVGSLDRVAYENIQFARNVLEGKVNRNQALLEVARLERPQTLRGVPTPQNLNS